MLLRWMPVAAQDLQRISDYLRVHAPEVEAKIVMELFRGVQTLQEFPYKGRPTKRTGIRQLVFLRIRYVVTYRVTAHAVEIMRIRHASQKPLTSQ